MEDLGRVLGQAAQVQHERTKQVAKEADDAICESLKLRGASGIAQSGFCAPR